MKKIFKLCAVGGMALVIAACGNGEEETDTGEESATEENTEVEEASSPEDPVSEEEEIESEDAGSEDGTEADDADSDAGSGEAVEEDADEDATAGGEESKTFVYEEEGYFNELVYYYIDDEVQRQTSLSEIDYEALNVSGEDEAREMFEAGSADYSETNGVTHNIEYGEDGIVETLEVDYNEADLAEVAGLEGSEFEEGAEDAQFISMERSEEQVLAGGYELVEE